ncbi:STM4015 family protein [Herbidospora daliensis]|uniref:STM4015 family protein n=1 Tax=Herbidospora daliensis TaxID=295585 RepID=UPI000AA1F787|nr:STM4015 family protein [Herbidospora daliensis]
MFFEGNEIYGDDREHDRYLDAQFRGRTADPRDCGETFLPESGFYDVDRMGAHRETFAGLPVAGYRLLKGRATVDPALVAWPLHGCEMFEEADEDGYLSGLEDLLAVADGARIEAIVAPGISARHAPAVLAANAHRLPRLRSLFLGCTDPEYQISWITHADITPVLEAFPLLERLDVRGADGLELKPVRHSSLRILRFETGGLPEEVVRAIGESELPALEHVELWLGTAAYGGGATVNDLAGILGGTGLPALRRLGLRDSEIQDRVAAAVAAAPVVSRLEELSLAMGSLTDDGVEALLTGQPLTHLRRLDLHHHFVSEPMGERLRAALPEVEIDLSEPQDRRTGPYISVAE